jgi:hypothetical protein
VRRRAGRATLAAAPDELRAALGVAAIAVAVTALSAAIVRVAVAPDVRAALDFGFASVPRRPGEALAILRDNGRMLTAVFAATVVAQLTTADSAQRRGLWWGAGALLRAVIDAVLAVVACANLVLVGAAIGAYGGRMVLAILPHGPFELAAYALALGAYLRARRCASAPARLVRIAAWSFALLAVAAMLETYVRL